MARFGLLALLLTVLLFSPAAAQDKNPVVVMDTSYGKIRIELDAEYLRAIAIAEALPENQSGADKTWVWRMEHAFREHFKRVRPL